MDAADGLVLALAFVNETGGDALVGGSAIIAWDPVNGASFSVDLGAGVLPIFSNIATPGFAPDDSFTFAFSARTGGSTETLNLDNVMIVTIPEPSTVGLGIFGIVINAGTASPHG